MCYFWPMHPMHNAAWFFSGARPHRHGHAMDGYSWIRFLDPFGTWHWWPLAHPGAKWDGFRVVVSELVWVCVWIWQKNLHSSTWVLIDHPLCNARMRILSKWPWQSVNSRFTVPLSIFTLFFCTSGSYWNKVATLGGVRQLGAGKKQTPPSIF